MMMMVVLVVEIANDVDDDGDFDRIGDRVCKGEEDIRRRQAGETFSVAHSFTFDV